MGDVVEGVSEGRGGSGYSERMRKQNVNSVQWWWWWGESKVDGE